MVALTQPRRTPFAPYHQWDRNAVLAGLILIWLGILMGFGPEIAQHVAKQGFAYPLIVHLHAFAFVGWLLLLTVQVGLVRAGRSDLHRQLGVVGVVLAAAMVVLGPTTAWMVDRAGLGQPSSDPAFMAVQFSDIAAFAGLAGAAFLARRDAPAHKRLILLATFYIADAGFSRWLYPSVQHLAGPGFVLDFAESYLGNDLLILAMGAYDLATRRRPHPAYVVALVFIAAVELAATTLHLDPAFAPVAEAILRG